MKIITLLTMMLFTGIVFHDARAEEHSHEHEQGGTIELNAEQIRQAGIVTEKVTMRPLMHTIRAPGTVTFDAYALADITTQVDAVVHARHVRLGEKVVKGQKLVTLNSTALAQAEASYLKARAEHNRSRQELGRLKKLAAQKIVSQARLQQAESTYQAMHANLAAARAALYAYGLDKQDIANLLRQDVYGRLTLRSPHAGTVVEDNFRLGQHVAAGSRLMQVANESHVWVEVNIPENQLTDIRIGGPASVMLKDGDAVYQGRVINIHHQLDAATRTAGVRLEIGNADDALHPGMFVQAEIATGTSGQQLLVPEQAVQRQGRELIVFVEEEPGHFERREVVTSKPVMGLVPLLKGVQAGERIVVKGAFVLVSELAKSGFEAHHH